MMVKPVRRPRFWITKGIRTLPFLSSSWQTSFISGNYKGEKNKSAEVPLITSQVQGNSVAGVYCNLVEPVNRSNS
jgi:hypothetical protein